MTCRNVAETTEGARAPDTCYLAKMSTVSSWQGADAACALAEATTIRQRPSNVL